MPTRIRIGIVGDRDPARPTHPATERALEYAAALLGTDVVSTWLPTPSLTGAGAAAEEMAPFGAFWCAPGSPYASLDGALAAIRVAREDGRPLLGTCGGFQHIVLEFARNVLGLADAAHAEYDPEAADPFIAPLACSLFGRAMEVRLEPGSIAARGYEWPRAEERYRCGYGVAPARERALEEAGLRVTGRDANGEARIVELSGHPFFVGTLFVPQMRSTVAAPHPLVLAFVAAALEPPQRRKAWIGRTVAGVKRGRKDIAEGRSIEVNGPEDARKLREEIRWRARERLE